MDRTLDPRIESYLNRLTAPLERTLDHEHLQELRDSATFHIESLAEEFAGCDDAVGKALREFGQPDLAGLAMLDEWSRGRRALTFSRCSSGSAWWSFVTFGGASALSSFLLTAAVMWPGGAFLMPFAVAFFWIAPVVAGSLTGYLVPTGNLRAFGFALLPVILHGWVLSLSMTPYDQGTDFSLAVTAAWPPIGALSLSVSAWLRRNRPSRSRLLSPPTVRS